MQRGRAKTANPLCAGSPAWRLALGCSGMAAYTTCERHARPSLRRYDMRYGHTYAYFKVGCAHAGVWHGACFPARTPSTARHSAPAALSPGANLLGQVRPVCISAVCAPFNMDLNVAPCSTSAFTPTPLKCAHCTACTRLPLRAHSLPSRWRWRLAWRHGPWVSRPMASTQPAARAQATAETSAAAVLAAQQAANGRGLHREVCTLL